MEVSPRLPGLLQTLKKHAHTDDTRKRPRIDECLPCDALEAIMEYLDRESLCTARLVCKTSCAAASVHVCSLTLPSTSRAVSFHSYPHVGHVTVRHACSKHSYPHPLTKEESLAHLDPCLRDLVTALIVKDKYSWSPVTQTRDYLSQAALMPELRKLEVTGDVDHEAALARCTNLEAITFLACSISVARTIVTMTRVTSLDLDTVFKDGGDSPCRDISWLEHATNLRGLQELSIDTLSGALPLVGNLMGLTGLTMWARPNDFWGEEATYSIAPLTRLTRLRSLSFRDDLTDSNLRIACSLGTGSLVNLELWAHSQASADCGRLLSRQTALTRLSVHKEQLCNVRHIAALRIEQLQCLYIGDLGVLDAEGLSVLSRATSLTELQIGTGITHSQLGLSQALASLTQLRRLMLASWHPGIAKFLDLPLALNPLTALTKLKIDRHSLDDGGLQALLLLTGLRVLKLSFCRLSNEVLPQLGVLTNLSTLSVWDDGVTSLAPVSDVLDPLRKARGWPPLHTSVSSSIKFV